MDMYDDYKNSGITWTGMVPSEWEVEPLWTRCDAIVPMRDKPTSFDGDIPWVKIEDFQGKYIYESKSGSNVSRQLADSMNMKSYPVGTVLCSCSCDLGKCAVVGAELYSNQTFIGLVADGENLISSYLYYLMQSSSSRLNYLASGSIQTYLSKRDFLHLKMVFPPLLEQEAISNYLDSKIGDIDSTINNAEKSISLLNEYRKSIITEAVTHGLDPNAPMIPSGKAWIGETPQSWKVMPWKYIAKVEANLVSPEDYKDLPQVAPANIEKNTGKLTGVQNAFDAGVESDNHLFRKGAILYSKVRPALNKVAIAPFDGLCSADMYPISTDQNVKWLVYYMLSATFTEQVSVSTNRVKMPKLNKEELGKMDVVLPPKEDQDAVVNYLDTKTAEIDALIASKERQVELLREYRKSIIFEAVTGKFKVPGLE